jgi:hypothetical protein
MRKKAALALCLLGLLLVAAPVAAEDVFDPPWYSWGMDRPNQTEQGWECDGISPLDQPVPATWGENEFGWPDATFTGFAYQDIEGPQGPTIATWHAGEGGGTIEITIKNNPDPDTYKLLFWQVTSDKSPTPTGSPPSISTPGGATSTWLGAPYPHQQWNGTWYTYNGYHKIEPNPEEETITFDLVECTNVSEIVINTICVPEPATLSLLALGAVVFIRRRR